MKAKSLKSPDATAVNVYQLVRASPPPAGGPRDLRPQAPPGWVIIHHLNGQRFQDCRPCPEREPLEPLVRALNRAVALGFTLARILPPEQLPPEIYTILPFPSPPESPRSTLAGNASTAHPGARGSAVSAAPEAPGAETALWAITYSLHGTLFADSRPVPCRPMLEPLCAAQNEAAALGVQLARSVRPEDVAR